MAIVHIKGIEALGVWLQRPRAPIQAWTGEPNAPVALLDDEPALAGWAEILALAERIQPQPRLIPADPALRSQMLSLCHEVMGESGLVWSARLAAIDFSLKSGGQRGFPVPVAQYLGHRYGYTAGCGEAVTQRVSQILTTLSAQLGSGPYILGEQLSALDIYTTSAIDALALLPDAQCPMTASNRAAFETMSIGVAVPAALLAHRDMMHEMHIPLPLSL